MVFATFEPARQPTVSQACLVVLGAGRTAMLFMSEPTRTGDRSPSTALAERIACIQAACDALALDGRVAIAQALPDPGEAWATSALEAAAFRWVGDLAYLRRPIRANDRPASTPLPTNAVLRTFAQLGPDADETLTRILERSYESTLDCPELCGLRSPGDILASHKATGAFDPSSWFVLEIDGRPLGCTLLSRCPEQHSFELVYLGLAPEARGRGIARAMMDHAIDFLLSIEPAWSLSCAVDERNLPARRLYASLGFTQFGRRRALVRPIHSGDHSATPHG